ncbi:MAG: hypothetical protein ACQEXQ_25085 [Bacillota bacterium]
MMLQAIGQVYYFNQDYEKAVNILGKGIESDFSNSYVRIVVRYYLASLHAIGQTDNELYSKLIKADPIEKDYITNLTVK